MPTIGLCMIVKNEAHVITRCLDSVCPLVDHVLIEDTGSTDATRAIATVPHRIEAFHAASLHCRQQGRNEEGYQIARQGLALTDVPPPPGLGVQAWMYEYGLLDDTRSMRGYLGITRPVSMPVCVSCPTPVARKISARAFWTTRKPRRASLTKPLAGQEFSFLSACYRNPVLPSPWSGP